LTNGEDIGDASTCVGDVPDGGDVIRPRRDQSSSRKMWKQGAAGTLKKRLGMLQPISLLADNQQVFVKRGSKDVPEPVLLELLEFERGVDPCSVMPFDENDDDNIFSYLDELSEARGRRSRNLIVRDLVWTNNGVYHIGIAGRDVLVHHRFRHEGRVLFRSPMPVSMTDLILDMSLSENRATVQSMSGAFSPRLCCLIFRSASSEKSVEEAGCVVAYSNPSSTTDADSSDGAPIKFRCDSLASSWGLEVGAGFPGADSQLWQHAVKTKTSASSGLLDKAVITMPCGTQVGIDGAATVAQLHRFSSSDLGFDLSRYAAAALCDASADGHSAFESADCTDPSTPTKIATAEGEGMPRRAPTGAGARAVEATNCGVVGTPAAGSTAAVPRAIFEASFAPPPPLDETTE
jgi:hypothetical protein